MKIPDKYDTIFTLRFEDPELAELRVQLRRSYGLMDAAGQLLTVDLDALKAGQARPEDLAKLRQLVDEFAVALVAWNLTAGDSQPVGTDAATVRGLDMTLVLALVDAFMDALQLDATQATEALQVDPSSLPMQVG